MSLTPKSFSFRCTLLFCPQFVWAVTYQIIWYPPIHLGYETQIFCVFRTNSFGTRYAQFKCAHTNHLYASVPIHLVPPNHLDCFVPIHLVRIIAGWETRPLQKESTLKFKVDFLFRFCSRSKPFKWDAGFDFFDPSAI